MKKQIIIILAVYILHTISSESAGIKVTTEYRYPTEYNVTPITAVGARGAGTATIVGGIVEPTHFVTRDVGVTFNVNATAAALTANNDRALIREQQNLNGNNDLIIAATQGDENKVQKLLSNGANVNSSNKYGATALMGAAVGGFDNIVKMLLLKGANINAYTRNGDTALMYAARNGHLSTVKLLLNAKASVNSKNKDGLTALMYAINNGNPNIVKELINHNANIHAKDKHGTSPIMLASSQKKNDIVLLLTRYGAKK